MDKTLGVLGFGRIGQLVAQRAMGFGMRVVAFDPFVSAERYRELGVEKADGPDDVYARADFLTLHLPKNDQTEGWLNAEALQKCKDGVRVLNVARGPLIVDADLQAALDSGKVAGAALDVFRSEPVTDHPLFGYPNVIVTPHLGASTAEATDRAGFQAAEQVVAALTGGAVSTAVNVPAVAAEDLEVLGPFLPLSRRLGRLAMGLAEGSSVERVEVEFLGRIAERDTRPLGLHALVGVLTGHVEEEVNEVSAPAVAGERGIALVETKRTQARDFTDLVRVTVVAGDGRVRVAGTTLGRQHRPHLVEAWGHRFNVQFEDDYMVLFRYLDRPGMIGRAGTSLRRARREHQLGGRRPRAGGRRQRRCRGDGPHDRRARARHGARRHPVGRRVPRGPVRPAPLGRLLAQPGEDLLAPVVGAHEPVALAHDPHVRVGLGLAGLDHARVAQHVDDRHVVLVEPAPRRRCGGR